MPAGWLVTVAWLTLALAFGCAAVILFDLLGRGYRQPMPIMNWVWPVTALYLGPIAVWGYLRWGRPESEAWRRNHSRSAPSKPAWVAVSVGVSHCGAGCTVGDIAAEFGVYFLGATIAGQALLAEYLGDYVLAVLLGLVFQYCAIAPMRGLSFWPGLKAAAKADILSLTAFEVGLFAWMALQALVFFPAPHHLQPTSPVYWLGMQFGMILGFATAYPVNAWLIRVGIKEAM
ncbi:MAG: DUF4396 domain-containing protein [Jatrophihabitantaceae bacterium]